MPEIPELEAYKYVVKKCLHKKITDIQSSNKKLIKNNFSDFKKQLINHAFSDVKRKGKYLEISSANYHVVMHFGLTGFVIYSKDSEEKIKFSRVTFIFNDDSVLHWISIRQFGKIWLVKNGQELKELSKLGADALTISKKEFLSLTTQYQTKNIKAFLMDQSIIAGIGNEYSDEILFQAGIDPHHKIADLSQRSCLEIYNQIKKVLKYAITVRLKDIKKMPEQNFFAKSNRSTFKSSYLQAHRHIDMVCPHNKNHVLKKATIAGRTTYYCPKDQK